MTRRPIVLIAMAFLVIFVNCLAVAGAYYTEVSAIPLGLIATAAVIFTSLVFLCQDDTDSWFLTEQTMRTAVSGTIVFVYLDLIIYSTFNYVPEQQSALAGTLIANFSAIVGVVIASYFGASAYIQARNKDTKADERTNAASRATDNDSNH
jgi:uncharacterized PurR-regulated membrane protein YhhQ (DUF165 family)